jgi:hypothetical protein
LLSAVTLLGWGDPTIVKRALNILVSSTRQWNPGDEFIFWGVRSLVEGALGKSQNWMLWNRNPDLFMQQWRDPRVRIDTISNSANTPNLDIIDLVVLAGTPEWTGGPVAPLYDALRNNPDLPLLAVGVGSGADNLQLSDAEIAVLSRPSSFITTRGRRLAEEINSILGIEKARAMPCPAVLCASATQSYASVDASRRRNVGLIIQDDTSNLHAIEEQHLREILEATRNSQKRIDLINFYSTEFVNFSRASPTFDVRYSFDPFDCFQIIGEYRSIVSTRLHGAIAAISQGIPSFLISRGDYRLATTQELFSEVLPLLPAHEAIEAAQNITDTEARTFAARVDAFKSGLREQYTSAITAHLASIGFHFEKTVAEKRQSITSGHASLHATEQAVDALGSPDSNNDCIQLDVLGSPDRPSFTILNSLIEQLQASHRARRMVGVGEICAALQAIRAVMERERAQTTEAQQIDEAALSPASQTCANDANIEERQDDIIVTAESHVSLRTRKFKMWPFGIHRIWSR